MSEDEFEKLFKSHFAFLSNIAYAVVKDEDSAKDIAQQVFIKLWEKRMELKIRSNIKAYLHRAVVNTAINYIEKNKKIFYDNSKEVFDEVGESFDLDSLSSEFIDKKVRVSIEKLPPKCQVVFSLSRFSGMSNKEIAEEMNISLKAVEKHIGNALKHLRISLKPLYKSLIGLIIFFFGVGFFQFILSFIK